MSRHRDVLISLFLNTAVAAIKRTKPEPPAVAPRRTFCFLCFFFFFYIFCHTARSHVPIPPCAYPGTLHGQQLRYGTWRVYAVAASGPVSHRIHRGFDGLIILMHVQSFFFTIRRRSLCARGRCARWWPGRERWTSRHAHHGLYTNAVRYGRSHVTDSHRFTLRVTWIFFSPHVRFATALEKCKLSLSYYISASLSLFLFSYLVALANRLTERK